MFEFYKTHKLFWMIPLELPTGEIMGFIIRGFTSKDYRTISFTKHPLPFGFLEFGSEGFISDDHPVIIVEGVRDALFIKTFYPFCLSLNMGKISLDLLEILTKFIDNFILLTDMDETGRELVQVNRDLLLKKGKHVFIPTYKQKDVGSYFYVSEQEQEDFINSVLEVFNE